jgi:hypothetical protein
MVKVHRTFANWRESAVLSPISKSRIGEVGESRLFIIELDIS